MSDYRKFMSDYRKYMTESQKLESETLAMRPILAKQADEALHDAAIWMQRALAAEELVAECAPFLKEGERPVECIKRNRADADLMIRLLAKEKEKLGEAQKDTARLEFILQQPFHCPCEYGKGWIVQAYNGVTVGSGLTPIEALDAAMKVTCTPKNTSGPRS